MIVSGEYVISSWILSKATALSYLIAFMSLMPQLLGLYGQRGILSIDHLLNLLDKEMKADRFYHVPSFFWLSSSDGVLRLFCFLGMLASGLALLGFSQSWMLLFCWLCYLSFVSCGQIFLSYQWDSLLLELGFLALFFAPFEFAWLPQDIHLIHPLILLLVWLLIFKLMFLSGLSKILSKDFSWRDLTALSYHYWTQPLPTPLSFWVHKLPLSFHKMSAVVMFAIELIAPFAIFATSPFRHLAAIAMVLLQIFIVLTGNFAFFNIMTLLLCASLFNDFFWKGLLQHLQTTSWPRPPLESIDGTLAFMLVFILVPPGIFWIVKSMREKSKALDFFLPVMRFLYPFRISNPYGLFAIMTKKRPEIQLEGSVDGKTWLTYELKYKPGRPSKALPLVAPHQPRLDWQMWFAALESFNENLWLQNVVVRIFENSPDVLSLFEENPFPNTTPRYLRFSMYEYSFASLQEWRSDGIWWRRLPLGLYSPVFDIADFQNPLGKD